MHPITAEHLVSIHRAELVGAAQRARLARTASASRRASSRSPLSRLAGFRPAAAGVAAGVCFLLGAGLVAL